MNNTLGNAQLFDTSVKEINPYWVDEKQKLKIPNNPLHYYAHRLQILLDRLDKQAASNPAQFNSSNYIAALDKFSKICEVINNEGSLDEILDTRGMAKNGNGSAKATDGGIEPISMDP